MDVTSVIIATAIVAGSGLIIGLFLGFSGKKFAVEVDELEIAVSEALPGNNCGGCGYAGCDALAKAIATGEASPSACPVGGQPVAAEIAKIMGLEEGEIVRKTAFVMCAGSCEKAKNDYEYFGTQDCKMLEFVPDGGPKACKYGCHGYGDCVRVCEFDAIHIVDGIAIVDEEKCKACGKCVTECPRNIIEMIPYGSTQKVMCSSKSKGKDTKAVCSIGCIACKLCEKACEFDAIKVVDNIAHIDYNKCTKCRKCAEKCPVKVITM